jgi:hypothetical protein
MSYDPTERAPLPPERPPYGQVPQQPPAVPMYGQSNPAWGAAPVPQTPPIAPTVYGQSNPPLPSYGQPPMPPTQQVPFTPAYGQSNPPPAYGQSNPYPYDRPPGGNPYPADPYAPAPTPPYQPEQPWSPGVPPAYQPAVPPKKSNLKAVLITLTLLLILAGGGGGTALYFATRPQPVISVTSKYTVGTTPAGASSTSFTVVGHDFSGNSSITFLLDGTPVPGGQSAQSDRNGNISALFTLTDAWTVGNHTMTARDASGYLTKAGKAFIVVPPGQASTPGPHGAPTDSANITINATVNAGSSSGSTTLTITGSADGGKVCGDLDDGQAHTHTGTSNGVGYTETAVHTCGGTYKGGKLSYTETATSDKVVFDNGLICNAHVPYVSAHMEGAFTDTSSINGSYSEDTIVVDCNMGVGRQSFTANTGTWTGVASVQ